MAFFRKNRTKKSIAKKLASFLIIFIFIIQLSTPGALAQSEEITSKLEKIKLNIERIARINDRNDLPEQEKNIAELSLKREILLEISNIGKLQIEESQKNIDSTEFPETEDWKIIRELFNEYLNSYKEYYNNFIEYIEENTDVIDLEEIKNLAKEIDIEKTNEIDPGLERINDVVITFDISKILSLASERLEKVNKDITKIYEKGILKEASLKNLFTRASSYLENAYIMNNNAKEVILQYYSIKKSIKDIEKEEILKQEKAALESILSSENSSSTESEVDEEMDTKEEKVKEEEEVINSLYNRLIAMGEKLSEDISNEEIIGKYIRNMTIKSLDNVKETYKVFIEMSVKANQLLK